MNNQENTQPITQFRKEVFQNFNKRADTLMDLVDALSSNTQAVISESGSKSATIVFLKRTNLTMFVYDKWYPSILFLQGRKPTTLRYINGTKKTKPDL